MKLGTVVLLLFLGTTGLARGAEPPSQNAPDKKDEIPSFKSLIVQKLGIEEVTWNQPICVKVSGTSNALNLTKSLEKDNLKLAQIALTFNGHKVVEGPTLVKNSDLCFRMPPPTKVKDLWAGLSDDQRGLSTKGRITISGPSSTGIFQLDSEATLTILLYEQWRLYLANVILVILTGFFILLALRSNILRDRTSELIATDPLPPYSLARCQMAFWTFIVLGSYIFIYAITLEPNGSLNKDVLILFGISTGTLLGAAIIESGKDASANKKILTLKGSIAALQTENAVIQQEVTQLETLQTNGTALSATQLQNLAANQAKLANNQPQLESLRAEMKISQAELAAKRLSDSLVMDLLTDSGGVSIHRFQMLAWTLILGLVFVYEVFSRLAMPTLDPVLLSLMGISSGTYIGFKIPEKFA